MAVIGIVCTMRDRPALGNVRWEVRPADPRLQPSRQPKFRRTTETGKSQIGRVGEMIYAHRDNILISVHEELNPSGVFPLCRGHPGAVELTFFGPDLHQDEAGSRLGSPCRHCSSVSWFLVPGIIACKVQTSEALLAIHCNQSTSKSSIIFFNRPLIHQLNRLSTKRSIRSSP